MFNLENIILKFTIHMFQDFFLVILANLEYHVYALDVG